jgi:hypothetical protein
LTWTAPWPCTTSGAASTTSATRCRGPASSSTELRTFARVVIWTTRCNPDVEDRPKDLSEYGLADKVHTWLKAHDMPYDEVFTAPVKPLAAALIDDRAISCRPMDFLGKPEGGGSYSTAEHYAHVVLRARHLCGISAKQDTPVGAPAAGELFAPPQDPSALKR